MKLNVNEQKVLNILKEDPYISQKDISEKVNVSRPAVANIISSLQQKGYILGKPYLLRENRYVTCIGGANFDINLRLDEILMQGTSNPVRSSKSMGGVVRNVAENLARLGVDISLMSLVGDDPLGQELITTSKQIMETFATELLPSKTTGTYYSIIDQTGDMKYGFADMEINDVMDRAWILRHKKHLYMSDYLICDLNVTKDAVEALLETSNEYEIPLAIIGVSGPKMKHLPKDINGLDLLICNQDETNAYFNTHIEDGKKLCQLWLDEGVKNVVVTMGTKGSYVGDKDKIVYQKAFTVKQEKIVDVTGAGDAFSSAVLYGIIKGKSLEEAVKMGAINASLTVQLPYAVNPNISIKKINKELEKNEK
jgi:sugar/nucleoside kinase (ribokinase family)